MQKSISNNLLKDIHDYIGDYYKQYPDENITINNAYRNISHYLQEMKNYSSIEKHRTRELIAGEIAEIARQIASHSNTMKIALSLLVICKSHPIFSHRGLNFLMSLNYFSPSIKILTDCEQTLKTHYRNKSKCIDGESSSSMRGGGGDVNSYSIDADFGM